MYAFRYSKWDGTQNIFPVGEEELMDELADQLMNQGDVSAALRSMVQRGVPGRLGDRLKGLQDFLQQLKATRQQTLDKYDLSSVVEGLQAKLDHILETERGEIEKQLQRAQESGDSSGDEGQLPPAMRQKLLDDLKRRAEKNKEFLETLPKDMASAVGKLKDYEFMDSQAKQEFDELMQALQQRMAESFFKDISQSLRDMSPEQMQGMKQMARALNRMLQEKMKGGEPDFQDFMDQFGQFFGPDPPASLDELMDRVQRQIAQMQSLLESMSPEQRQSLQDLLQSALKDEELRDELAQLAANLEYLDPMGSLRHDYPFRGDDSLTLDRAMKLMEQLQKMDDLERQLKKGQQATNLDEIDEKALRDILGDDAAQALEQLKTLTDLLEQAGYIRRIGTRYELTPKGTRKIGQKALQEIFAYLKRDRIGEHTLDKQGFGAEYADDTKIYEFGDPFLPHLHKTIMNAVLRESNGVPVKLHPEDFEVYRTEQLTQSSTVLMLDLSLSMAMRGNFMAAKKVALALDNLIRTQFPRDNLFIVGFSTYAREVKQDKLPYLSWDEFDPYTNIQHGLALAQKLLSRVKGGSKQIIMISDGEPTAHMEGSQLFLQYPPSPRTIRETLREVKRCTQMGIVINTFMLDRNSYLIDFVEQLTKINRGRVFYTTPEGLGQYILVDYVASRRKKVVL